MNMEELVGAFLAIRKERERLVAEFEAADNALKRDMKELEVFMLLFCNEMNANSINTAYGTVIRKLDERYFCSDWGNFYNFIRDTNAPELLEKRIHQKNFKTFLEDHKDDGLPPGVNLMREYGVTVRKSVKEI